MNDDGLTQDATDAADAAAFDAALQRFVGCEVGPLQPGPDEVNVSMSSRLPRMVLCVACAVVLTLIK